MTIRETMSTMGATCDQIIDEIKLNFEVLSDAIRPHRKLLTHYGITYGTALAVTVGTFALTHPLRSVSDAELDTAANSIYAKLPALNDSGPAGVEAAAAVDKFCIEVKCGSQGRGENNSALEHSGTQWVHRDENAQALNIEATRDSVDRIVRKNSVWTYFVHPERAAALHELDRSLPHFSQAKPSSATCPRQ